MFSIDHDKDMMLTLTSERNVAIRHGKDMMLTLTSDRNVAHKARQRHDADTHI